MIIHKMRRLEAGDTIVEVLLSMTILALVGVTAFATSTRSFHSSLNSQLRDQGISYAQQQIELLKNIDNGAANMANYITQTGNFCVNPSDLATPQTIPSGSNGCATTDADFKVTDTYSASTKTFTITATWTSANGQPTQTTLYYKPGSSYVTCTSGSCTPITPPQTNSVTNPPAYSINISTPTAMPISYNGSIKLVWNTSNITPGSCQAVGNWTGDLGGGNASDTSSAYSAGGGYTINNLTTSPLSYDLKCKDLTGVLRSSNSGPVSATVSPAPAVTFNYFKSTVDPSNINYNTAANLIWSTTNATSCTGSGFNTGGATNNSSGVSTGNLTSNTTYTLNCTRASGVVDSVSYTVRVNPAPAASISYFYPGSSSVGYGGATYIYWGSSNATQCYSPSTGYIGTSGYWYTGALYGPGTWTYQVECQNAAGVWTSWAYTYVSADGPPPPPCSAWASGSIINASSTYISGGGSSCGYYYDSVVGWNGGGTWGPTGRPICHTQQGGADPWGWLSSSDWCSG